MKISKEELNKIVVEKISENQKAVDIATKSLDNEELKAGLVAVGFKQGILWLTNLLNEYEVK